MSDPREFFVVQVAGTGEDGREIWLFDLTDVFVRLESARTYQAEFYFEDKRTRIVKMKFELCEVIETFELPESVETVPAGSLF